MKKIMLVLLATSTFCFASDPKQKNAAQKRLSVNGSNQEKPHIEPMNRKSNSSSTSCNSLRQACESCCKSLSSLCGNQHISETPINDELEQALEHS